MIITETVFKPKDGNTQREKVSCIAIIMISDHGLLGEIARPGHPMPSTAKEDKGGVSRVPWPAASLVLAASF